MTLDPKKLSKEHREFYEDLMKNCNSLRDRAQKAEARIEELEKALVEAYVGFRAFFQADLARIEELEKALVEERARRKKIVVDEAREQLQKEGMI
jgi:uncharacterized protein involved in exopolysaccharide biosynthesis